MDSVLPEDPKLRIYGEGIEVAVPSEPDDSCPSKPSSIGGLCNGEGSMNSDTDFVDEDYKNNQDEQSVTDKIVTKSTDNIVLNLELAQDEQSNVSLPADVNCLPNSEDVTKFNSSPATIVGEEEEDEEEMNSESPGHCNNVEISEKLCCPEDAILENGLCSSVESKGDEKDIISETEPTSEIALTNNSGSPGIENHTGQSERMSSSQQEETPAQTLIENNDSKETAAEVEVCTDSAAQPANTDVKESIGEMAPQVINNEIIGHSITCVVNQEKKEEIKPSVKKQKARKSCQPQGGPTIGQAVTGSYQSSTPTAKSSINVASFAKKTIKVTELESVLGIKTKSLDKMDAKTLDKLVLQKAQQQRAKIDGRLKHEILRIQVKTVNTSEGLSAQSSSVDRRNSQEPKAKNSGPTSRTLKGKGSVSPSQLITQYMVREPEQKNNAPLFLSNNIRKATSEEIAGEAADVVSQATENFTEEVASPSSKLITDTGTSASGVSAYIAGQHLLSRSKKKKNVYKGKSGTYRLPGQRKANNLRRADSTDSSETLKQRRSSQDKLTGDSSAGEYQKSEDMDDLCDELPDLDVDLVMASAPEISLAQSPRKKRKYTPRRIIKVTEMDNQYQDHDDDMHDHGKDKHKRRSDRKRKLPVFNDDTESTISTETYGSVYDSSDNELDELPKMDEEEISTEEEQTEASKRRKVADEDQMTEDNNTENRDNSATTIPHLSPIKPPPSNEPSVSKSSHLSPPKISPALPFMGCSPRVGPVPAMEEKKPAESAAVPQEIALAHPYKFMNTPNGVSYPVTPPETPDSTVSSLEDRSAAAGDRDREGGRLPVCFCRLPGNVFTNYKAALYCQALDSVDGKVKGCMNKVTNTQLLRPSVKIPFLAMCESHKQRLKVHHCCPGCGNFCTQGTFYQCKESSPPNTSAPLPLHYHHKHCQLHKDDKYFCPHCGDQSAQYEVYLQASQSREAAAIKYDKKDHVTNARMEFRRCSTDSTKSSHSNSGVPTTTSEERCTTPCAITPSVKAKFTVKLDTEHFPIGPCKKDLEKAIQQFSCEEKKKKFRASNKNLYQACKSNDLERVLYLLYEGIDPNEKFQEHKKQSPIHVAASKGYLAIVHLLVQARASVHSIDEDLRTALMYAAEEGYTSVVRYLLKCHAVPDARASDGMTPLHLAAQSGEVEAVKHIVQTRNISVNIKDDGGWTPMIWAAEHRHIDTVRFLLEVGSDPNLRDNEDNTGLHWAVYSGSTDIAELFLNAGCDIEAANEHGDRPLHIATRQGHYECVVLLLARGSDSTAVNNRNDTPLNCYFDETSPIHMAIQVNQQLKKVASQIKRPPRLLHRDVTCGKEQYPIAIVNEFDDENYPTDYLYVNDYVETVPMNMNRVITSLRSCECRDNCVSLSCECSRNSVKCWYTDEGKLPDDFNYSDPPYVFECNKACKCWASCQNRVVQMGISVRLQVFRAEGKGWGVRTLLEIPKGTYVCEYIGEVLSDAEADRREDDSYLFDLDNRDSDSFCIDARQYGNVSRFINHRCEPNLSPVKVFVDHQDLRFPRICFFANKDIKAYEELGFDYGDKFWVIKYKQFTCTCDSTKCRYSKDSIHKTVAEYYRRLKEVEDSDT